LISYKKEDWNHMARRRMIAFENIAKALGPKHEITKMMGARAWGRHNFEQGPDGTLQTAVRDMSSLDGAFDILNTWARDNDHKAQRIMLNLYPRGFESLK
jgi:hypothetical protein